jgi:hypothetical protein
MVHEASAKAPIRDTMLRILWSLRPLECAGEFMANDKRSRAGRLALSTQTGAPPASAGAVG